MQNIPQNILVIGYVWPEPKSSAAGSHMLSFMRLFQQQGWEVTFASPAQRSPHRVDLPSMGIKEFDIALNCSSFDEFLSQLKPDMVVFDRFMMEEQFGWRVEKHCPQALRIIDTEDLHFLRGARHQAVKQNREMKDSDLFTEMAKREVAAIFRSDLSLIISDFEIALLKNQFNVPASIIQHCPFMLIPQQISNPTPLGFAQRKHFISIGNFRHAPNWDAVLNLRQYIWPAIRQQLPDAELHVYGAYPPPKATQLHAPKQGFLVKGWVENADEVMQQARVCLAPLRFGAGLKGKLVQAMQFQTPIVTTPCGAEGMVGNCSWPGFIAKTDQDFIAGAVNLYQDQITWEAASQSCHPLLNERFDGQKIGSALINRIKAIKADLTVHRAQNFIGQMLLHHTMKSTQYMSQWIEAKNKR